MQIFNGVTSEKQNSELGIQESEIKKALAR